LALPGATAEWNHSMSHLATTAATMAVAGGVVVGPAAAAAAAPATRVVAVEGLLGCREERPKVADLQLLSSQGSSAPCKDHDVAELDLLAPNL